MRTRGVLLLTFTLVIGCRGDAPETGAEGPEIVTVGVSQQAVTALTLDTRQESGRQVFETLCWTCHGSAGRGDGPAAIAGAVTAPPNFLVGEYADLDTDDFEARFEMALAGQDDPHPHMRYVTSILKPDKFADALSYIPALIYPALIPGSAIAGGALYQTRCQVCHGAEGR